MTTDLATDYGVLALRGAQARTFLNGQTSQDVNALGPDRVRLAGLHSVQGRTLAILSLLADGECDLLALLPRALLEDTLQRLRRYVLRAKVTIEDETSRWHCRIWWPAQIAARPEIAALCASGTPTGSVVRALGQVWWRHAPDGRVLSLQPRSESDTTPEPAIDPTAALQWHRADIACGLPWITRATQDQFVAQMLNLDALEAISFTKGCYTGQEIIARAHYRGRVKRRLQGFETPYSMALQPADRIELADGRRAEIVMAAPLETGGQTFLAVTQLPGPSAAPGADHDAPPPNAGARIEAVARALPYALPD